MDHVKYVLSYLILLISRPHKMWEYLVQGDNPESDPDHMQRNYYLPLLGCMAAVVFVCDGFGSAASQPDVTFDLQHGMMQMVPRLVAYFVGPYLAIFVLRCVLRLMRFFYPVPHTPKERMHLFVFYSTSFLVVLEMLSAMVPRIRFVDFIAVYVLYITWTGATIIVRMAERHRWLFGLVSAMVVYLAPFVIVRLVHAMQG